MLDNIDEFISTVFNVKESFGNGSLTGMREGRMNFSITRNQNCNGSMYCPKCGGERRISIQFLYAYPTEDEFLSRINLRANNSSEDAFYIIKKHLYFSLWKLECTQCDTIFTVTFYKKNNKTEMTILPSCNGGVVTRNTPPGVSYYLDQAYRAKSVGANSACIAMYRGALDQLLHQQGYVNGMLGNKLAQLEKDIKDNKAPKWAEGIDIKYLSHLNALGSGSIHPNDGDIEKQKEIDNELIEVVDVVFSMLLDYIYEKPVRDRKWLSALEEKSKHFKWNKK